MAFRTRNYKSKNKNKMKQIILIPLFLLTINLTYCQQFSNLSNIEDFFNKSKFQVDSIIKNNGYLLVSTDTKTGSLSYENIYHKGYYDEFKFNVTVIFKGNKLKNILWNDLIPRGAFITKDIQNADYKVVESKTDDALGLFYLQSPYKNLNVIIFRTAANTNKRMMSFHLFERLKTK